jgi:phage gpG-like protein
MFTGELSGDFGKLTAFGNRIGNLGAPATMRTVAREIADEALFQVQVGFSQSRDPYYRPWANKKLPDGRGPLRGATGKLQRSFVRFYVDAQFAIIGSRAREAAFAQTGTGVFGPNKRPITPKRAKALRFKSGGRWVYAREVEGSQQRLMMPQQWRSSKQWTQAFVKRASLVLKSRMRGGSIY